MKRKRPLYGLGVITVNDCMIKKLEKIQNVILCTLGLSKLNHLSGIKAVLNIKPIHSLYLQYKCILINLLNRHHLTKSLLNIITMPTYITNKISINNKHYFYEYQIDPNSCLNFIELILSFNSTRGKKKKHGRRN